MIQAISGEYSWTHPDVPLVDEIWVAVRLGIGVLMIAMGAASAIRRKSDVTFADFSIQAVTEVRVVNCPRCIQVLNRPADIAVSSET